MKSDAVWVVEKNRVDVRPVEIEEPKYDEVQIETKACGVCAWDSYLYQGISAPGPIPYVIGHEGVGIVRKVGDGVKNVKPGDKVFCSSGGNAMMGQYYNTPHDCLAKIPDDVTDYAAWVLEPAVCVVNLLHKCNIVPGDDIVLVGAGYMGLQTLQGLVNGYSAGSVTVFEIREDRLAMAKELNPTYAFNPNSDEGKAHIQKIKDAGGADLVIDFAASESGYALATELIRFNAGTLALGTWHRHRESFDGTDWHMSGVSVLNLSPMSNRHYTDMIPRTGKLVERGIYNPGIYVTHTAHYKDIEGMNDLFKKSITKEDGYIKGVIMF